MRFSKNKGLRPQKAIIVAAGGDRFITPMDIAGWRFECKLSGRDTSGDYCVYDTVRSVKGGPPLHLHRDQDEWFYVRTGEFLFRVGGESFQLRPGDTLLGRAACRTHSPP
jgi:mannose-6-phosphate isomerase-like protein (cupin superfamily)